MQFQKDFKILDESLMMVLGHVFETVYCIEKHQGKETPLFEFYGDPTCGIIGKRNDWFLVGGERLILKTNQDNTIQPIGKLKDVHDLRLVDDYAALVLTDPWKEDSAIYKLTIELNATIRKIKLEKIRDFSDYFNLPYTESVHW